jgi:hypothetical protein
MIPILQLSPSSPELAQVEAHPHPRTIDDVMPDVVQALAAASASTGDFQGAVLVGSQASSLALALRRAAPSIGKILILESDPRMVRTLAEQISRSPAHPPAERMADVYLAQVERSQSAYSTDAYLECAQFFLDHKIPITKTFYYIHETETPRPEPIIAALDDLFYAQSQQFLALFSDGDLPTEMFLAWAGYLAGAGEPYHAIGFFEKLRGLVDPSALAQTMVRCWIPTQCFEAIEEWTTDFDNQEQAQHFRGELKACLLEKQETEAQCFQANLAALRAHQPELAERLDAYRPTVPHTHAFLESVPWLVRLGGTTERAQYPILFAKTGPRTAVHLPINPNQVRQLLTASWKQDAATSAIVIGTTKKPELLLAALINEPSYNLPNWRQAVYVIEKDLDHFHHLLHVLELAQFFEDTRIQWFVGDTALTELVSFLDRHPDRLLPRVHFETTSEIISTLQLFEKKQIAEVSQLCKQLVGIYDDAFLRQSTRALCHGDRPFRVFIQSSIFTEVLQYAAKDMRDGFESLGVNVHLSLETSGLGRMSALTTLRELIAFQPDAVVLLDHLRSSFPFPLPSEVPFVTWIQDDLPHLAEPRRIRALGPSDHAYGVCLEFVEKFKHLGYPRMSLLGMAANPRIYAPGPSVTHPRGEVAFITHMQRVPEPPNLPGLFDWLRASLGALAPDARYAACTEGLLLEGTHALGLPIHQAQLEDLTSTVRLRLQREVHRVEVLRWLTQAGVPLALYGKGWADYPEFRAYARPPLPQGRALCEAYQTAKVILHVNSTLNCHQRVFECLAAGGFVTARSCPSDHAREGLSSQLVIGEEIPVFGTRQELLAIVDRAFHDEPWRQQMIQAGRRRVLSCHTYAHRMQEVMGDLRRAQERRTPVPGSAPRGEERVAP